MDNMRKGKVFGEYLVSRFDRNNISTEEQYEKTCDEYEIMYGRYLPKDKDASILDVGCGTGDFLFYLKKKGYRNYLGVDISSQQVEFCKNNISGNVQLADALEFLRSRKDTYDIIAANDLLEHIPKSDIILFVELVRNALKHNGSFVRRTPNMSNPFSLDSRYKDFTHEIGFTPESLYQVLWVGGFREIEITASKITRGCSIRNLARKMLVSGAHRCIKFLCYIQDFTVPQYLGKNLIVMAKKRDDVPDLLEKAS